MNIQKAQYEQDGVEVHGWTLSTAISGKSGYSWYLEGGLHEFRALTGGSFPSRLLISGRCRAGLLMTQTMVSGGTACAQGVGLSHSPRVPTVWVCPTVQGCPGCGFVPLSRGMGLSHSPAPHLLLCCISTHNDQPWQFFHAGL